jgi:hypothetical protein
MKQLLVLIFCSLLFGRCTGVTGSGRSIKENRTVGNFTGLSVSQSIDVTVRIGNSQSLQIEADDNIIGAIETRVIDGVLEISYADNHSYNNTNVDVEVIVPYLNIIKVSSSAEVVIKDRMRYDGKVRIQGSSSGEVKANIVANGIVAEANSSANIILTGTTISGDFSASSSGEINASNLDCESAVAAVSSSGSIDLNVSKSLNATASSSGDIRYKGSAVVAKTVSSSGSVEKQ